MRGRRVGSSRGRSRSLAGHGGEVGAAVVSERDVCEERQQRLEPIDGGCMVSPSQSIVAWVKICNVFLIVCTGLEAR